MNNSQFKTWLSYLLLIIAGIAAYAAINNLSAVSEWFGTMLGYVSPFLAGIVIAYLLDIPCSWIEVRLRGSKYGFMVKNARGIGVVVSYACAVAVVVFTMNLLIPEVVRSVREFVVNLPVYFQRIVNFAIDITGDDDIITTIGLEAFMAELSLKSIIDTIGYDSIYQSILSILSVSAFFINATIAIVSSVYLMLEADTIAAFFSKVMRVFIPQKNANLLFKYLRETNQYFKEFLYCTLIDGIIIGTASVVGLAFIDVRYAVVLGIVEGVLNMIPYFGAIVGTAIVVLISLLTDGGGKAFAVLIFLFILQQIDGNVIKVKLYGDSFQISPFLVLFSITVGGAIYGVVGMVAAIPLVAVLKSIINDAIEYKLRKNAEKGW